MRRTVFHSPVTNTLHLLFTASIKTTSDWRSASFQCLSHAPSFSSAVLLIISILCALFCFGLLPLFSFFNSKKQDNSIKLFVWHGEQLNCTEPAIAAVSSLTAYYSSFVNDPTTPPPPLKHPLVNTCICSMTSFCKCGLGVYSCLELMYDA